MTDTLVNEQKELLIKKILQLVEKIKSPCCCICCSCEVMDYEVRDLLNNVHNRGKDFLKVVRTSKLLYICTRLEEYYCALFNSCRECRWYASSAPYY